MLTMDMPGDGIELRIVLSVKYKDPNYNIFRVKNVECNIDKLSVKLTGTKHDKLYNMFVTLAKSNIKKKIETAMEEKIADMIRLLNGEIAKTVIDATKRGQQQVFGSIGRALEGITNTAKNTNAPSAVKDVVKNVKDTAKMKAAELSSNSGGTSSDVVRDKSAKKKKKITKDTTTTVTTSTTTTKLPDEGSSRNRPVGSTN